jgi:RNA-directed DNA polymerase
VGTPQGGVLSPLLSNMVLNGIQKVVNDYNKSITPYERLKRFGTNSLLYLIRYADDFVILSPTTYDLDRVAPLINDFLKERGLKISETKTRTVSIHDGFDFLG